MKQAYLGLSHGSLQLIGRDRKQVAGKYTQTCASGFLGEAGLHVLAGWVTLGGLTKSSGKCRPTSRGYQKVSGKMICSLFPVLGRWPLLQRWKLRPERWSGLLMVAHWLTSPGPWGGPAWLRATRRLPLPLATREAVLLKGHGLLCSAGSVFFYFYFLSAQIYIT